MRVLVCGSRRFTEDWEFLDGVLSAELHIGDVLIHGDAEGTDRLSEEWFREMYSQQASKEKPVIEKYPADWKTCGRAAGPMRNTEMLEKGKPDKIIAFWDGESLGTKNLILQARRRDIPTQIVGIPPLVPAK